MTCKLYRHFNSQGRLLYVGISLSAVTRLSQHMAGAHWSDDIARVEVETHESREDALRAEYIAIITEAPAHNVKHNKGTAPKGYLAIPSVFDLAAYNEDGEPYLLATMEDGEGDQFLVDFPWNDEGEVTITTGEMQYVRLTPANLSWLSHMHTKAVEWSRQWKMTPQYADFAMRAGLAPHAQQPPPMGQTEDADR